MRRFGGGDVVRVLVVLGLFAAVAAAGGWAWHAWWAPAPAGVVAMPQGADELRWYPQPWDAGQRSVFGATAQYVILAVGLALVLGVLAGLVLRRRPLLCLVLVGVAAVGASLLMAGVGSALGPVDPATRIPGLEAGDELPGALAVTGWSPYLVWPGAALLGFLGTALAGASVEDVRRRERDEGAWLSAEPRG